MSKEKMIKQLFINGRFLSPQKTGVQRYAFEVITAIDKLITEKKINQNGDVQLVCLVPPNTKEFPNWNNIKIEETGKLTGNLWEQISLPIRVGKNLLFSPTNIGPIFTKNQVVTIHDASVFAYPEAYSLKFKIKYRVFFRYAALTKKKVITVSEFSRRELQKYCFSQGQEITVIHHGHNHLRKMLEEYSPIDLVPEIKESPYFLVIGSRSHHKNYQLLVDVMKQIQDLPVKVLIVGGDFPAVFRGEKIIDTVNLQCLGYVSDKKLLSLYQYAKAVILPSKYEGFGFPLIEALSFGVPVICSDIPAFKEVGNGFVDFFNPESPNELVNCIRMHIADQSRRPIDEEVASYLQSNFTWTQSGLKTWSVIRNELAK